MSRPDPPEPRRALAIFAHPDDVDFGAAGTVARWVREGWDVRYVSATSGQKGGQDATVSPRAYGALREAEQRAAAAAVGVSDVTFLGLMDSEVFPDLALRLMLSREFRRHRPHRLLTMDPQPLPMTRFANHPDHRAVGQTALDVTMTGGTTAQIFPELVEEGLPPWRGLAETWLMGPAADPVAVDITGTLEQKIAALQCHASQIEGFDVEASVRKRVADAGAPHGLAAAETFRVQTYVR